MIGGSNGGFTLYEDEGDGFDYQNGIGAMTQMTLSGSNLHDRRGERYISERRPDAYRILWSNVSAASDVLVSGVVLVADDAGTSVDAGNAPDT